MTTIVWYSYKGGVGRSMSLANVCSILADEGYSIGVMDLDLHAPGLDQIPPFKLSTDTSQGVLSFLSDLTEDRCSIEDIEQYGRSSEVQGKDVFFLRAGPRNTEKYANKLAHIRKENIFGIGEAEGPYFLDQIEQWFEKKKEVDFFLVDARTGLSEVSGVSTIMLADALVFATALNENNIGSLKPTLELITNARPEGKSFGKRIVPAVLQASRGETEWSYNAIQKAEDVLENYIPSENIQQIPPWTGAAYRAGSIVFEKWAPENLVSAYRGLSDKLLRIAENFQANEDEEVSKPSQFKIRLKNAEERAKENPSDAIARFGYGKLLWEDGKTEEALEHMGKAVSLKDDNVDLLVRYAEYLYQSDKVGQATVTYRKAINLIKNKNNNLTPRRERTVFSVSSEVFFKKGQDVISQNGEIEDEMRLFNESLDTANYCIDKFYDEEEIRPGEVTESEKEDYVRARLSKAKSLDYLDFQNRSERIFEFLRENFGENIDVLGDIITFKIRNKSSKKAEREFKEAIERGIAYEYIIPRYIDFLIDDERPRKALNVLEEVGEKYIDKDRVYYYRGTLLFELGMYNQSIQLLRNAVDINPSLRKAWISLTNVLAVTGNYEEAADTASAVIERFDENGIGFLFRAIASAHLEQYRDAIPDIEECFDAGLHSKEFLLRSAVAAKNSNRFSLAERCYKKLLEEYDLDLGETAKVKARYAWLLSKHDSERRDEAEALLSDAKEMAPEIDSVQASEVLINLDKAYSDTQSNLNDVDLDSLISLCRDSGEAHSVPEFLTTTLSKLFRCESCTTVKRWISGASLAKTLLYSNDYHRAEEIIDKLEKMNTPDGFGPVMNDLHLTMMGLEESQKRLEDTSRDSNGSYQDSSGIEISDEEVKTDYSN